MEIPVLPFLFSLAVLLAAVFLWVMVATSWPLFCVAAAYFLYCGHREIWHNGRPWKLGR